MAGSLPSGPLSSGPPSSDPRSIEPRREPLDDDVVLPGSKSITNRALAVAALASGPSVLDGALVAADTMAMVDCLRALGATVAVQPSGDARITNAEMAVVGLAGPPTARAASLHAGQAGTVGRFLPPILALGSGTFRLDGDAQLRARPMGPLLAALADLGVEVTSTQGHLPLVVEGRGPATWGTEVSIGGDVSSQFISGLMLAAPLLPAGLRIHLTTEVVSRPYLHITAGVMASFGASATVGPDEVVVASGTYAGRRYRVEPDASAASYLLAAATVAGGRVRVEGLGTGALQGDARFVEVLAAMGAEVDAGPAHLEIRRRRGTALRGVTVNMADMSDLVPTLAVVAAFADSPTRISGVGFIRAKESDRIAAVVEGLRRIGVDSAEEPDGLVVRPAPPGPHGGRIETYDDHRIAMSFAVVGLAVPGIQIVDPQCVAKSFPTFWAVLDGLGR